MAANLLALDTATDACSTAVWRADALVFERFVSAPRRHAELILPMLDEVLAEAGLSLDSIDAIAFGRGPGSFTGLRIAAGIAQGIAFAADKPVLPISTLAALAFDACRAEGVDQVAVALDARMGEVYWGLYGVDPDTGVRLLGAEGVYAPARVPTVAAGDWCGVGSGWAAHGVALAARCPVRRRWPDRQPRAGAVAALAALAWARGEALSAEQALPVYLRDQVASPAH
ncbi:MAG: tRNA (adenosine(37)-N6)-threonylcarbamoyltransferase complex dimerization subunit type 1 TsaB [Gammaproteobacteria bacterium]